MGILTQIIAADESDIEAIGESLNPADEWSGVERRDIDIPMLATLHSVLTGDLFDDALVLCEPIYISPSEGAFVIRLSDYVVERLATFDEDALAAVAEELAGSQDYEMADFGADEINDWLLELAEIARPAHSEGHTFFAWLHPLRT
jgi:hypothetical protein